MIDPALPLLAAHAIGDWAAQTDYQAAHKARPDYWTGADRPETEEGIRANRWFSWRVNQAHIATYHLTLLAALIWYSHGWSLVTALAFSWIVHSFLDRRWPVKRLLQLTGSKGFAETPLGILATDQALHIATLAVMTIWLAR